MKEYRIYSAQPEQISHRGEEHGKKVDHCLHVEASLGSHAGCGQQDQAADCWKQHLGDERAHGEGELWVKIPAKLLGLQSDN